MAGCSEPIAQSPNGDYFAYSGSDGKLRLWETSSGRFKQEYTPSAHLSATCTCLSWGPTRNEYVSPRKKRRRSTRNSEASQISELNLVAMGTATGTVLLYSLAKGDLHTQLSDGHTDKVNGIGWHSESDSLFSCSDDQHIVHWNVSSSEIREKWKADKSRIYSICVIDEKNILSASSSIKWWDVEKKTVIKKFSSHVTEVIHLLPVFLRVQGNLKTYCVSAAVNDRQLTAWHIDQEGPRTPSGRFTLSDECRSVSVAKQNSSGHPVFLTAVTKSGILHVFDVQLNGKCQEPFQPNYTVQVASDSQEGKPKPIPILSASVCLDDPLCINIAYGSFLKPTFERLSMKDCKKETWLLRQDQTAVSKQVEENKTIVKQPAKLKNANVLVPGHMAPSTQISSSKKEARKRKLKENSVNELPMEDRLTALEQEKTKDGAVIDNLSHLLLQGLQSKDVSLLNSVLQRNDEVIIKNTVRRLPVTGVPLLLQELQNRMHSRTHGVLPYIRWMKSLISTHACYLMTLKDIEFLLNPLQELLEARSEVFEKLCRLRGRLDLILSQMNAIKEPIQLPEPSLIYQEESSEGEEYNEQDSEGWTSGSD